MKERRRRGEKEKGEKYSKKKQEKNKGVQNIESSKVIFLRLAKVWLRALGAGHLLHLFVASTHNKHQQGKAHSAFHTSLIQYREYIFYFFIQRLNKKICITFAILLL